MVPIPVSSDGDRSAAAPPPLPTLILLVALAGAAGAVLRLSVGQFIPEQGMKFPWTTLAINISGSGMLGILAGVAAARSGLRRWVVPVLGTGFLGSYTTFSLVILAVLPSAPGTAFDGLAAVTYVSPGTVEMFSYLVISIIGSTAAAAAGITIGRALFGPGTLAETPQPARADAGSAEASEGGPR